MLPTKVSNLHTLKISKAKIEVVVLSFLVILVHQCSFAVYYIYTYEVGKMSSPLLLWVTIQIRNFYVYCTEGLLTGSVDVTPSV